MELHSLYKYGLLGFLSTGILGTIHIVLGIIIALINIAILLPVAIEKIQNRKNKK